MKAKKSLIVASVAGILAIGAVGTSFALYLKTPDNKVININSIRTDADINYAINVDDAVKGDLNPANDQTVSFKIHGYKTEESNENYSQPYVAAKLTVTITPSSANFWDAIDVTDPVLTYKDGTYFGSQALLNTVSFGEADETTHAKTGTLLTYIYVGAKDTWVNAPGTDDPDYTPVSFAFSVKDSIDDKTFVEQYAELAYSVDVKLEAPDEGWTPFADQEGGVPYLVGTMNGWATSDGKYEMVANIEAEENKGAEWIWVGSLPAGEQVKGWRSSADGGIWSEGNNAVVPSDKQMTAAVWNGYDGYDDRYGPDAQPNALTISTIA